MKKSELTEYADFLLGSAMRKCANLHDAEDLVQDTLLAALSALEKGDIENPRAWLTAVLNRKYYDTLRRKYNKPAMSIDIARNIPREDNVYDNIEKTAEAENIRRCLACLSKLYREVMVRRYIHGEKVADIAAALGVSENTVKSRLSYGRKRMEREYNMENFTKQSYEPDILYLSISGKSSVKDEPFSLVGSDKIAMNLLLLAYKRPVTVTELSKAIGIPTAYIEPVTERLIQGELMKKTGDKIYTDFIIYTQADSIAGSDREEQTAQSLYRDVWQHMQEGFDRLHGMEYYKAQPEYARPKLDSFFAVKTLQKAVFEIRDEAAGGTMPYEDYPDRPNGGKWLAMGFSYPGNFDFNSPAYEYGKYSISGECHNCCEVSINGGKRETLHLCELNTLLGATQLGSSRRLPHPMTDMEIARMLYALYLGRESELPVINAGCFENTETLLSRRYLHKQGAKTVNAVPVITDKQRWEFYDLSCQFSREISEKYHSEIMQLMSDPVKLPPHLTSVPKWQQYMLCGDGLPMRMIKKALDNGLFTQCADYPAPAIMIAVG